MDQTLKKAIQNDIGAEGAGRLAEALSTNFSVVSLLGIHSAAISRLLKRNRQFQAQRAATRHRLGAWRTAINAAKHQRCTQRKPAPSSAGPGLAEASPASLSPR